MKTYSSTRLKIEDYYKYRMIKYVNDSYKVYPKWSKYAWPPQEQENEYDSNEDTEVPPVKRKRIVKKKKVVKKIVKKKSKPKVQEPAKVPTRLESVE